MKKGIDYIGVSVCFACHDGKGNYLFAKRGKKARDEQGRWEIPGGGIEVGESIEEALHRELKEELCIDSKTFAFVGYREFIKTSEDETRHWIVFLYLVEVDPKAVSIGEPEACDELCWSTLEKPPEPLHSAMLDDMALIQNYLHAKTDLL